MFQFFVLKHTREDPSVYLLIYPYPSIHPLFIPEGGCHRHVDEHRGGESLSGALRDHIWHALHCEVGHGLQPVNGHVEMLCEGADMVHGRHLKEMPQNQ